MPIYGQDWASYQSAAPATSGLSFAFVKVTEGTGYANPLWTQQRDHAKANGLVWGGYHYPHMANSATAEADFFLSQVAWQPGDVIILDWEGYDAANSGVPHAQQVAYKDAWLAYVKAKMPHNPVGVYMNADYWNNVDTTGHVGDFLWIATAGRAAGAPGISAPWMFHQYSSSPVDSDYCPLPSADALKSWALTLGDDMPLTQADADLVATTMAAKMVTEPDIRDASAFAVFWWLQQAINGTVPPGASAGWAGLLESAHTVLNPDATAAAVWNHALPDWGLDSTGKPTALGTTKSAYWHQVWNDVYAAQQRLLLQQVLTAAQDAKLTPAELQQALVDGTLKVQITVAPSTSST